MRVFTYSEARQHLSAVLKEAKRNGVVQIRRRDGQVFALRPENSSKSPLDVKGVDLGLSRTDIVSIVRESREPRGA